MRTLPAILLLALPALLPAATITFEEAFVADGDILSNQYFATLGVTFSAGTSGASGILNPVATAEGFATNTNLQLTTSDVGGTGISSPLSGRFLNSFSLFLAQDGDGVITIDFLNPIVFFSADFGSVGTMASTVIYAVDGSNTAIGSASPSAANSTVGLTPSVAVSRIVITVGDLTDWVAIDNITFTDASEVPEPSTVAMIGLGLLGLGLRRRAHR